MSFNTIYFLKDFVTTGENDYLIRVAQAADAESMTQAYNKNLAEIVAINDAIETDEDAFTPVDASLAAAGDGHTFLYTVTFTRTSLASVQQLLLGQQVIPVTAGPPAGLAPFTGFPIPASVTDNPTLGPATQPDPIPPIFLDPRIFITRFGVASTGEEVQAVHNRLIDEIAATIKAAGGSLVYNGFYCPFQDVAGGAKGQRFMVAVSGAPIVAPQIG